MTDTISEGRSTAAARLLGYSGFRGPFSLTPLSGGKNNQVFRVDLADQSLVLKAYFQHPGDPRDRLGAEFAFSTFAWNHGLRSIPQPLACDDESRLALYEFVPGRKIMTDETTPTRVSEAVAFYRRLNELVRQPDAARLPAASEACFRLSDHWHCLARRSDRLRHIEPQTAVDRDAFAFVSNELAPLCDAILEMSAERARTFELSSDDVLPAADRCLSPSDFGFHNALLTPSGSLTFLDFEYAGWDDPAKTVCDFFCQPELPAPSNGFDEFAAAVSQGMLRPETFLQRCELLLPVYRLKWCCIMLNDFLPAGNQRRRFAQINADEIERKARQLAKARQAAAVVADSSASRIAA